MPETLERPNFVFINTDQQRWDTLGCYGSSVARTPNIDQLAAEGTRFDACYASNPVCMPARASWFTGQYPSRNGTWQNGVPLSPSADMIHTRLKAAGYHTALLGKIHLDNIWQRSEPHPAYGFDLLAECEGDPYCKDAYFRWLDEQGLFDGYKAQFDAEGHERGYTRDLPEDRHMSRWVVDHAEAYFRDRAEDGRPFFLSLGFFDPHHPFDPVEPYAGQFRAEEMPMPLWSEGEDERMTPMARRRLKKDFCLDPGLGAIRRTIAAYHATVAHVDAMVGRVMKLLEETGLERRTVVIFTSDHGEMLGDHGILWKGPLFYEGAIRVPLIYRFPRRLGLAPNEVAGFVSHVDLAATVAALAGVEPPRLHQGRALFGADGRPDADAPRDAAVCEWRGDNLNMALDAPPDPAVRCLVDDRWKFVYYHGCEFGELYDRANDPHEFENLWTDPAADGIKAERIRRLLDFGIESEPTPVRTDIF